MNTIAKSPKQQMQQRLKKYRGTQRIPADILRDFQKEAKLNDSQLADVLYFSHSVVSRWLRENEIPAWVPTFLEGLKRTPQKVREDTTIWLVRPGKNEATLRLILESFGIEPREI